MRTTIAPARGRRLASVAAFVVAATTLWGYGAYEVLAFKSTSWTMFGAAALVGAAAYGVGRGAALAQALARGAVWSVLAPVSVALAAELVDHMNRPDYWGLGLAATLAIGMVISRPLLHTERARRDFHPVAVRGALLAGSIASIAVAIWTGIAAAATVDAHHARIGLGLAAAATALAASGVGVVRMRTWGVLLGALTSTALVAASLLTRDYARLALALAAVPGASLAAAVLFARLRPSPTVPTRVGEVTAVRTRIAIDEASYVEDAMPASRAAPTNARHPAGATIA